MGELTDEMNELRIYCAIRFDLVAPDGKWMVQSGHAFVSAIEDARKRGYHEYVAQYFANHQPKIVLKAKNEAALQRAFDECKAAQLPCYLVTDLGRTVFGGVETVTCLGVGPCVRRALPKFMQRFQTLDELPVAVKELTDDEKEKLTLT